MKFKEYFLGAPLYKDEKTTESLKAKYKIKNLVKMSSNENMLGPSPKAVKAMQDYLAEIHRYPTFSDSTFRDALVETMGRGTTRDHFVSGNGGCDVLSMIAMAFLSPGDEFIFHRPTFPIYQSVSCRMGAKPVTIDLNRETFKYNVDDILDAITDHTRLIFLANPNNPTGNILTAKQMDRLVNNLPSNTLLVADEVYYHYVTSPDYPDTLEYVFQGKNVLILHSFSKAFGLAGIRLGYGIARPELIRYIARAREAYHSSSLAIQAGIAALSDTEHIQKTVSTTKEGRAWLCEKLNELGVQTWLSETNFIMCKPSKDVTEIVHELLKREIMIRPMDGFYLPTHFRVTVGLPKDNEKFINALKEVLGV
ncbi:MAG: histidinol-phosphate transaminase [Anaerolineaceae bacterium 4572_78]|nr:MAG: histidinol-phosphate transaminase [Anaerolineaceae bacterium 4572_78]